MVKPRTPKTYLLHCFDESAVPFYIIDQDQQLRYYNESFQRMAGLGVDEMLGKSLRSPPVGSFSPDVSGSAVSEPDHSEVAGAEESRVVWGDIAGLLVPPSGRSDAGSIRFELPAGVFPAPGESGGVPGSWVAHAMRWPMAGGESASLVRLDWVVGEEQRPGIEDELREVWFRFRRRHHESGLPWFLMGDSAVARSLREQFELAQRTSCHVQISGPSGSLEEELARAIHASRPASLRGPLIALECTLLDVELLQTTVRELVRSAQDRGAGRGCLLLQNVDRLEEPAQQELLSLIGFPQVLFSTLVTCRQPLSELARQQQFSAELAQRLSVLEMRLPALLARRSDLPDLIEVAFQLKNDRRKVPLDGMDEAVRAALQEYSWPGNAEELSELLGRVVVAAGGERLVRGDLPDRFQRQAYVPEEPRWQLEPLKLDEFLKQVESSLIEMALRQCGGNKTKAAQLLHLTRGTFHRKVDQVGGDADG